MVFHRRRRGRRANPRRASRVLQTQLSDTDSAAANKSAATFHAAPLNRGANVPPETGRPAAN